MPNPPAGFPTDRPNAQLPHPLLNSVALVLVGIQGPINLGLIARTATNLGIRTLRVVNPECRLDDKNALMFATEHGKSLLLNSEIYPDLNHAVSDCSLVVGTSGEFRNGHLGAPIGPESIQQRIGHSCRWALVFGNESNGLSSHDLSVCHSWLHLDTFGTNRSYNLAIAVGIAGYLIGRVSVIETESRVQSQPLIPFASSRDLALLEDQCLQVLASVGYARARLPQVYRPHLRSFLRRFPLATNDVRALRGILNLVARQGQRPKGL